MLSMCCVVVVLASSLKCVYDQLQIRHLQNTFWLEARSKKLPIIVFQDPKHLIATPPFPEIQEVFIGSCSKSLALHSSVVILSLHTLQFHPEDLNEIIRNAFRVSKDSHCLLIWKWCNKKHHAATPKRKILSTPPEQKSITWESIGHVH